MRQENTVIDIFCGAGGFSTGFDQAGFDIRLGFDQFEDALHTFANNHDSLAGQFNIQELDPASAQTRYGLQPKYQVMIGGPPCKGFSRSGKRDVNDQRNNLYYCAIDYANFLSPDVVLFENVSDLATMEDPSGQNILENIITALEACEHPTYNVAYETFDATEFGVPQNRSRLFVCAVRDDLDFGPEDVLDVDTDEPERVLSDVVDVGHYQYQTSRTNETRQLRQETALRSVDEPCYTLTADVSGSLVNKDELPAESIRDVDSRRLTIEEMAAVQTFPEDFEFVGNKTSIYKQIGHSVPPRMAYHFATRIKRLLDGEQVDGQACLSDYSQ